MSERRARHGANLMRRRVLVLGLDGADWTVIDPLLDAGKLPAFDSLIERGARGPLASTVPPISAAAWVSFLLGADPGSHGVLDFRAVDARRYEGTSGHVVTSHDYPKRTFFDLAGAAGRRVASVRVPMTYPAWPLNGVMVAGPPTPDDRRLYTTPEGLADSLVAGEMDIGNRLLEYPIDRQVRILRTQLERSERLGRQVAAMEPFDLTMVAVNTPDNAHHCFWHLRDGSGDDLIDRVYASVDRFVGSMLEASLWDLVIVMSDHGGGPRPGHRVAVNAWLAGLGALTAKGGYRAGLSRAASSGKRHRKLVRLVRRWAPQAIQQRVSAATQYTGAIEWPLTTAFGVHLFHPYFGVELNVRGRQREGTVDPEDAGRAREDLMAKLRTSAVDLRLPIRAVATRETVFGPGADPRLPDIVVHLADHAEGVNDVSGPLVTASLPIGPHETKSSHAPEGILIVAGDGIRRGEIGDARLEDLAPTILASLGIGTHPSMTGRVLAEVFDPAALPVDLMAPAPDPDEPIESPATITAHEEREIVAALQGLGYLE
jgi:predicted AlkP superfamily phosphohydrolase/phosphomutase